MKKLRGFTLIELMIAMAIIAILATAGISAYTGYTKKSRDTARAEIARNLNSSVMAYAASNGGNPPADQNAFDLFVQGAKEVFPSANTGSSSGTIVEDPVGGREVCLDAEGHADQPCAFHYTAYEDGTYAISYGVEHESSTKQNFYKTTNSVPIITETSTNIHTQTLAPKYGVYTGTAPYIGQSSTTVNGNTNIGATDGVDETYTPPGATTSQPLQVSYRSVRMDVPAVNEGGGENPPPVVLKANEEECTSGSECAGGYCNNSQCSSTPPLKGYGEICTNNSECSSDFCMSYVTMGMVANPTTYCLQKNGTSCTSAQYCLKSCVDGVCTDGSTGSPCLSNSDCNSINFCSSNQMCQSSVVPGGTIGGGTIGTGSTGGGTLGGGTLGGGTLGGL